MHSLFFFKFFLQKVVVEEESQVKKSTADLFSPSSKPGETDPVRKVNHWFLDPSSYHVFSLPPLCDTKVSS